MVITAVGSTAREAPRNGPCSRRNEEQQHDSGAGTAGKVSWAMI